MRILHTSDWHLGARLCDRERIDEQKEFLMWLRETLDKESIDILLVSGDIFDSTNPPNSAEMLYYDFLCSIRESCCHATVIIGGNHDSITKLNSPKELLRHLSVYVNGGTGNTPEDDVITIRDSSGKPMAIVCAVPFLRERDVHIPKAGEFWQERETAVIDGIMTYYRRTLHRALEVKDQSNIPILAMGHLFITGSLSGAGQRDLYVGNLGSIPADIFSDGFDYTALGHIHKPQKVASRQDLRYCGSPLHMDFGEKGDKQVLISEFNGSELLNVISVQVPEFRKLIRFKGDFEEVINQLDEFDPPDGPFWADAEISGGKAIGDINKLMNERALGKGFEFLRIKVLTVEGENILSPERSIEIKDLTVEEVFIKRCEKSGLTEDDISDLLPLYNELMIKVEEGDNCDEN
ncbi:MAG: exonuclease SbcCD subunit D C-terminal domain-containing protein [Spirochaetaceae bacterium]|nr:exonuclease SbcCD subunit D C-terminal domain-containing protein [Spirochaetaceae bacterium]